MASASLSKETCITKEMIAAEALATYWAAREVDNLAAACAALELLARLHGYIIEKRETRVLNPTENFGDEAQAEADRLKPN
jgi:hypothetical protein